MPVANNDYVHDQWGDTRNLTPAPALSDPLIVTDYEQSGTRYGPDGQSIEAGWQRVDDEPGLTEADGDRVWRVSIDGNGGDVWLQANRPDGGAARPIDFGINIENARNVRITGLEVDIDDIRTVNGYHPDDATGFDQVISLRDIESGGSVFIEGVDIDMNSGGDYPIYRTDAISAYRMGSPNNPLEVFAVQNSRITGISSSLEDPESHADAIHFQSRNYIDQFVSENVYGTTKYQYFQMNYDTMTRDWGLPDVPQHSRFYNTHLYSEEKGVLLFTGRNHTNFDEMMSLEFEDTYFFVTSEYAARLAPNTIYDYERNAGQVDFERAYVNARSNIEQADGDIQPNVVSGEDELFIRHDRRDMPSDSAPANVTGSEYSRLWDEDGRLLTGPGSDGGVTAPADDTSSSDGTSAADVGDVRYSADADRSSPRELDGAAFDVGDTIYAFVDDASPDIVGVEFRLNGSTIQTESVAPWDINGGATHEADGLDTSGFDAGTYTLDTVVTYDDGGSRSRTTLTDTFRIGDTATTSSPSEVGNVRYSANADRSSPRELDGASFDVGDTIYAFVDDASPDIVDVEFLLNGSTIQNEGYAPWDIQGGSTTSADGLDTSGFDAGTYTLDTVVTYDDDGSRSTTTLTDVFDLV